MTTEPEFTAAEQAEIAAHAENAKKVLGITEAKPGDQAPSPTGQTPQFVTADDVNMAGGLAALREAGIDPEVLKQVETGGTVTEAERNMVADWKAARMKDQDFVRKLLTGDVDARRQMLLADITLSAPIRP